MDPRRKRRLLVVVAGIAVAWAAFVVFVMTAHRRLDTHGATLQATPTPPANGKLDILWSVPAFSFVDQRGTTVTEQSLRGRVLIADFIFTRCTTVCPLTTAKMNLLRRSIARQDVRFVSFSVDPGFDTPAVLSDYAARWKGDARWILLSTTGPGLADVARGMKVVVDKSDDPDNPIIHSAMFFLIDGEGRVRGIYDSNDDVALKRLAVEAGDLERTAVSAVVGDDNAPRDGDAVMRGMQLFAAVGCAGCHDQKRVAPPLAGLAGRSVTLQGGSSVVADAAYIRESILDPASKVVAGFNLAMPVYRGHLSDGQADDLVAYLQAMPAPARAASAPAPARAASAPAPARAASAPAPAAAVPASAVDPVCGMNVSAGADAPHAAHAGTTYWFCSDMCRDRFVKNPEKYLPKR